jgi:hypothetical protein
VIAPSTLMLLYPLEEELAGYTRDQFLADLGDEVEKDIRGCFDAGAVRVPIATASARRGGSTSASTPARAATATRCTPRKSPTRSC